MTSPSKTPNLFAPLAEIDAERPALISEEGLLTHGALRRRVGAVQRWLADQPAERPLLLSATAASDLLPAFIAAGALGRTAAVGDRRWSEAVRARVVAALGQPLIGESLPAFPTGEAADDPPRFAPNPSRPFYVGFTSGTTGLPKAYARSHRSWIETMVAGRDGFALDAADRILVLGPLVHSLALYGALQALWLGGAAIVDGMGGWGVDQGATVVIGVPPLLAALARTGPHSAIRTVLSSGQALDPTTEAVLRRGFPKAVLVDFYGTSEQSFIAWRAVGEEATRGTVGRPFAGVEAEIRDAEGRPVAPGVQGRLHVKSPMVFDGYLEGLDRGGFSSKDGWSSVGDLGWLGEDGTLTLAGREGGMVVVRGVNVFPQEVEAALKALPGILDAGVVGLPDAGRGALLVALVEGEGVVDPAALGALRPEKRPRRIIGVSALPRTLTGKIDRRALAELAAGLIAR